MMKKYKNSKQLDTEIGQLKNRENELKHIISLEWESLKRSIHPFELIKNIWPGSRAKRNKE